MDACIVHSVIQALQRNLSIEKAMDIITEKLRATSAVRSLYTADGRSAVTSVDAIAEGEQLLASPYPFGSRR